MKSLQRLASTIFIFVCFLAFLVPWLGADKVWETRVSEVLAEPTWMVLFGRDSLGRDLFYRVFFAVRASLIIGFSSAAISLAVGVMVGSASAMLGGWTDRLLMRLLEILTSIPTFLWAGIFVITLKSSLENHLHLLLILGITLGGWMSFARHARSLVHRELVKTYVDGARMMGYSGWSLLWKHIRPNIQGDLLIYFGLFIPSFILSESVLSFIGIGIQAPETSLGLLIQESWKTLGSYPHLMIFPTLFLFLLVFSCNLYFETWRAERQVKTEYEV